MAKYNYVTCEEGVSQYDDYDLNEHRIVPARYVKAKLAIDAGNPYIEALPYPRTGRNIISSYSQTMADFDYDKIKSMSTIDKILQIRSPCSGRRRGSCLYIHRPLSRRAPDRRHGCCRR